jgi:hypothetical protein
MNSDLSMQMVAMNTMATQYSISDRGIQESP